MAVTITLAKDSRDVDLINLTVLGSVVSPIDTTVLNIVTPSLESLVVNLTPEEFINPEDPANLPPITMALTPTMLGLSSFEDGVYAFTYIVNYTDLTVETAPAGYILFDCNTLNAWMALMEKHIGLDAICSNEPEQVQRSEARELLNAATEFFNLSQYTQAKKALDAALEFLNSCT